MSKTAHKYTSCLVKSSDPSSVTVASAGPRHLTANGLDGTG